jgi:Flp pilus assembly protein TadG
MWYSEAAIKSTREEKDMPFTFVSLGRKQVKNRIQKQERGETGQSLVEMAIAFPILLMLLLAVIDFSRIIDAGIVLTNAAREGARYASKDSSLAAADIQQMVVNDVLGSGTNVTVMDDFSTSNVAVVIDNTAEEVTVTITYDFALWFGGLININDVLLTREAVMPMF